MKAIYLGAFLTLLPGVARASEFVGPIGAGPDGLRFSPGPSPARVSIAVAKTTPCGSPWYAYENADGELGRVWTETLTEAKANDRSVRIVGTGICDSFGIEGVSFVEQHVGPPVCTRSGSAPIITIDPDTIAVAQRPGKQRIGYMLQVNKEGVLILVEDDPTLQPNQIRLEVDIDADGAERDKAIEAWSFCQGARAASIQASMKSEFNVGFICDPVSPANNFRAGCTNTQSVIVNQDTTSELWLRKRDWAGFWHYAEGIDSSIWRAFGGRSVRFLWRSD